MHVNINKIRKYIQKETFITKLAIKAVKIIKQNKKIHLIISEKEK